MAPELTPIGAYASAYSICWYCRRAVALPDPVGCAFHRRDADRGFEGKPFEKAMVRETKTAAGKCYPTFIVTECKQFARGWR